MHVQRQTLIIKSSSMETKILMFPWLGYGHISPYLELAKKLTTHDTNLKVYVCSSLATLDCIEHKITDAMSHSIKLVPILFPAFPDLPRKLHTTNGLPPALMPRLKDAMQSPLTRTGLSDILSDFKPDLVIYDILQPWVPALARSHGIPAVQFVTSSCAATSVMVHYYWNPSGRVEYPFPDIHNLDGLSPEEIDKEMACANDPNERELMIKGLEESSGGIVLIKGFRELESTYIDYASGLLGKRFVPVGTLVEEPAGPDDADLLAWLDSREPKSTVYVSFGSEYFLTKDDFDEVARGLEMSGVGFVWVVRFPKGSSSSSSLPQGFRERVGSRGRVLEGWAPQAKILVHESTGGFVSHCGWNSVLEAMCLGVPIVALPMHLDQPMNARLVGKVGVGVEVTRDEEGRLSGEKLASVIREVVVEEGGEVVRKKAARMRETLVAKGDEEVVRVREELMALMKNKDKVVVVDEELMALTKFL